MPVTLSNYDQDPAKETRIRWYWIKIEEEEAEEEAEEKFDRKIG